MATAPARRSTRAARSSRSSSGRHQRGASRFDVEGRRNFDLNNHQPAQKWVTVKRPPAPGVGFTVKVWVPVDELTDEERKELFPPEEAVKHSDGGEATTTTSMDIEAHTKTDTNDKHEGVASSIDVAETEKADAALHAMTDSHSIEAVGAAPISSSTAVDATTDPNAGLSNQSTLVNVIATGEGHESAPAATMVVDTRTTSIAPETESLTTYMASSSSPKLNEAATKGTVAEAASSSAPDCSTTQAPEAALAAVSADTLQHSTAPQATTTATTTRETEVHSTKSHDSEVDNAPTAKRQRLSESNEDEE